MADQTTLNPGAGGDVIATEDIGAYKLPVSKIRTGAIDVDGGDVTPTNPFPVGGVNPVTGLALAPSVTPNAGSGTNDQSVFDARAAAARDELRTNVQALVDAMTAQASLLTEVTRVLQTLVQNAAGNPNTNAVVAVQGASGATPVVSVIQSPAAAGGTQAAVAPFNAGVHVTADPVQLFIDSYDTGTFDTTNRWQAPVAVGGGVIAPLSVSASQTVGTGTTAGGYSYVQTQPTFQPQSPGYLVVYNAVNAEFPRSLNGVRFWGIGTVPTTPTATTPITDGGGWQISTDGNLYAVLYQSGNVGPTLAVNMSSKVTDALVHKYFFYFRGDAQYWAIDNQDNVVLVQPTGAPGPNVNTLPYTMIAVAGNPSAPSSSLTLNSNSVWIGDTSSSTQSISDGTYAWRQANIKAGGIAPVSSDSALVVGLHPNTAIGINASTGLPLSPHVLPGFTNRTAVSDVDGSNNRDSWNAKLLVELQAIRNLLAAQVGVFISTSNDN